MELLDLLTSQLGISEDQAKGGAGALFNLAKEQLGNDDFRGIANAIPGMDDLLSAAPDGGGFGAAMGKLSAMLGGKNQKLGGLASLAGIFKGLGLDMDMVGKFVPVILSFVQAKGGAGLREKLQGVLS